MGVLCICYHLNQFVGFEDTWLREGAWSAAASDLPLNTALLIGVGIDKSPDDELGAVAIAQAAGGPRRGEGAGVRSRVRDRDGQHGGHAR